jgi:hypothetical protein
MQPPSPPLNCYYRLSNDPFAGWFAVGDKNRCNDFCFWKQSEQYYASNLSIPFSILDPHQATITDDNAKWTCLLNSASDDVSLTNAFDDVYDAASTIVFYDEDIDKVPFLRCSRGAGEQLQSNTQIIMSSVVFWSIAIGFILILLIYQIWYFILSKRRRHFYHDTMNSFHNELEMDLDNDNDAGPRAMASQADITNEEQIYTEVERRKCCNGSASFSIRQCFNVLIILVDIFLLYIVFTGILVIVEIDQKLDLPTTLKMLTPTCSSTNLMCPSANIPIDKPSTTRSNNTSQPFSYIIASDTQLNWYNGESAYIGSLNYPPPCHAKDSCGSCTQKFGEYTNEQIKKSIEKLINNSTYENNVPRPRTLVLNGDLTQYFHRHERELYENTYHNIYGLKHFFPGLGNHDYNQFNGATYNNDEWVRPYYCNGKHAVSYLKGAFCDKIPKFHAKTRITRYDPKSLSYSWEEGSYHFLQVHYYPSYENAGLNISSSIEWLERDLFLAKENNLTSVLFVHASSGLPDYLSNILLNKNVAVIFTGHIHRCLGMKCELVEGLNTYDAEIYLNTTTSKSQNSTAENRDERIEKCFPSSAMLCNRKANGNGLFYVNDMDKDLSIPQNAKLWSTVPVQRGLCPVAKYGPYLNESDNTSLCQRRSIQPYYPRNPTNDQKQTIPIFWSGSASYLTFLVANFYNDRIVVNVMTAAEGQEGRRYVDVNLVPNAVYPFHEQSDIEERTIFID